MFKLLIVDDERHARNSIRQKINCDALGIGALLEAADGFEALRIIKDEQPQVVLCDMSMDHMDGVELTQRIYASWPSIKIVIISGYDDYEYTRSAITNRAKDYILKPITPAALNAAIAKCIEELRGEMEEERRAETMRTAVRDSMGKMQAYFINRLIFDSLMEEELAKKTMRSHYVDLDYFYFCVAVFGIHNFESFLRDSLGSEPGRLDRVLPACTKSLAGAILTRNIAKGYELILVMGFNASPAPGDVSDCVRLAEGTLLREYPLTLAIGVGNLGEGFAGIRESYNQASFACRAFTAEASGEPRYYADMSAADELAAADDSLCDATLLAVHLRGNNAEKLHKALEAFFARVMRERAVSFNHVMFCCYELFAEIKKELLSDGASGEVSFDLDALYNCRSIYEIREKAEEILLAAAASLRAGERSPVALTARIKRYVDLRYNEKLTLDGISAQFYINKIYFLRLFKKNYGVSFLQYLTALRMDKARELLASGDVMVKDVARLVGYDDYRHFSKTYQKHFSELPSRTSANQ